VVTGAFSNAGMAVAAELIRRGWFVRTLTNHSPPTGSSIRATPLRFEPDLLRAALNGADAFVNTYWIRFPYGGVTFETAVRNSRVLIEAARAAGVQRFVQVSVSNADENSALGYYKHKAVVDREVRESGLSYAIVHPTLIVGPKDVLTNNMAWFLRRVLVFAVPSGSGYRIQPILLPDVGRIIADAVEGTTSVDVEAAGREVVAFREYLRRLTRNMGLHRLFVSLPPPAIVAAMGPIGRMLGDTVLTPEEMRGLQQDRLVSRGTPLGTTSVFDWLASNASRFGHTYMNDTRRRFRPLPVRSNA
jgi:uncharacterized protein YbjT (DUF2867 family)